MNVLGIGPLLALVGGSALLAVLVLHIAFGITVTLPSDGQNAFRVIGTVLCAIGLGFWISSVDVVSRAFKEHHLVTSGVYRLSRNPLYSAFIVFIIPGIALLTGNLLILVVTGCMFVCFKLQIHKEEEYLRRGFGDEYIKYARKVAQLIPFVRI